MQIIFASHNEHKVEEIQQRLSTRHEILSLSAIDWKEEIIEDGLTLRENAVIKAKAVFEKLGKPCISDDTGLEVNALDGAPGVFSARYAGPEKSALANMEKLLHELKGAPDRSARFKTCIALIISGEVYLFEGIVKGQISLEKRGVGGFGYDPIFLPQGYDRSFAEMSLAEKNQISHRALALDKLVPFLSRLG